MATTQETNMIYCEQHTGTITEHRERECNQTAHHIAVLAKNLQEQHKANVVIDPTTGASLEYRYLIKGPTKSIWENLFANEIG